MQKQSTAADVNDYDGSSVDVDEMGQVSQMKTKASAKKKNF